MTPMDKDRLMLLPMWRRGQVILLRNYLDRAKHRMRIRDDLTVDTTLDSGILAMDIERNVEETFRDAPKEEYFRQLRNITYHLSDEKNQDFAPNVLRGVVDSKTFGTLHPDDMRSEKESREMEKSLRDRLRRETEATLSKGKESTAYVCPNCGASSSTVYMTKRRGIDSIRSEIWGNKDDTDVSGFIVCDACNHRWNV